MEIKKYDHVQLKRLCDSPYLVVGDKGQAMSEVLSDGFVEVAFLEEFQDSHDCEGLVENRALSEGVKKDRCFFLEVSIFNQ